MEETRRRRGITSSLGSVSFGEFDEERSNKRLVVSDESDEQSDLTSRLKELNSNIENVSNSKKLTEKDLEKLREEKKSNINKVDRSTINSLEVIIGIGRIIKDVLIEDINFSIRSLKSKEIKEVLRIGLKAKDKIDELYSVRSATLAYALYEINNIPLEVLLKDENIDAKLNFIEELDDFVAEKLYKEYTNMVKEYKKQAQQDLGSNMEEIVETIKKS